MVKPVCAVRTEVASEYKRMLEISTVKHKLDSPLFTYDLLNEVYSLTYFGFDHYFSSTYSKCMLLPCNKPWPDLMSDMRFLCLLSPGQEKLADYGPEGKINTGFKLCLLPGGLPLNAPKKVRWPDGNKATKAEAGWLSHWVSSQVSQPNMLYAFDLCVFILMYAYIMGLGLDLN